VVTKWIKIGRPVVKHCCVIIMQKLLEDEDVCIFRLLKTE